RTKQPGLRVSAGRHGRQNRRPRRGAEDLRLVEQQAVGAESPAPRYRAGFDSDRRATAKTDVLPVECPHDGVYAACQARIALNDVKQSVENLASGIGLVR